MKLAAYLAEKQVGDLEFAESIGVTRQAVHRYKTGERVPEWAVLAKIKEISCGSVTPDDFLSDPSPPPIPDPAEAPAQ